MDRFLVKYFRNWAEHIQPPVDGRARLLWVAASSPTVEDSHWIITWLHQMDIGSFWREQDRRLFSLADLAMVRSIEVSFAAGSFVSQICV
jgi:hypothetical protein